MLWGSLIHFLLEHAMRGPARDRAHLARLANWFAFDKPELRRVIPEALDTVQAVMATDVWRHAVDSQERHVEAPFAVSVEVAPDVRGVLHGVIDLACLVAGGWTLLDYKTDQAPPATLARMYREQIATYARHWASLAGAPVVSAGLYSIRAREFIPVPLDPVVA